MSERNVLLKNVKHPFLVGLHYSFQTADKLYFVLDYINGGEVSGRLICRDDRREKSSCCYLKKQLKMEEWAGGAGAVRAPNRRRRGRQIEGISCR